MRKILTLFLLIACFTVVFTEEISTEIKRAFYELNVRSYTFIGDKVPKEAQIPFVVVGLEMHNKFTPISTETYGVEHIYMGRLNEDHLVVAFGEKVKGYFPVEQVWEGKNSEGDCLVIKAGHFVITWQKVIDGPLFGACRFLVRFINLSQEDAYHVYLVK